jgi:colanic acid/amylovoran biosynthesis glycosyltransferase
LRVLHCAASWLPLTQAWLYTQVRVLEPGVENSIACRQVENFEAFKLPRLHAESTLHPLQRKMLALARRCGLPWLFAANLARRIRPAVVHSHFGNVAWENIWTARVAGAAHVATFYGYDVQRLPAEDRRWLGRYRRLFDLADCVLCEGPHMRDCLLKLGCRPQKARVHHLGVQTERLAFRPRRWHRGQTLRVLIAASFVEKKGIPYGVAALGNLRDEVDLELTIIGDARNDALSRQEKGRILEALAASGLTARTRLLGYQPYEVLVREASDHHVFLAPSVTAKNGDTEGGAPVTIAEMAATGMMILSTFHCDIPHVIPDGECGLLAPERDVPALVCQFRRLLARPETWPAMAEAARRRIETEFNAATQGSKLAQIYRGLVGGDTEPVAFAARRDASKGGP